MKQYTHRIHFVGGGTLDTCDVVRFDEPDKRYYISRPGLAPCSEDGRIHTPYENVEYVEEII
jgi:hypothetical protein